MPAPYNIHLNPETGFYNFKTEQGLIYGCKFSRITPLLSPVLGAYDIEVHDFLFYPFDPTPEVKKPHDERVLPTIENLVLGHFNEPEKVLTYLCDFTDGRAGPRARLFAKWSENMGLTHHEVAVSVPPLTAHVGVLTRPDFPHPEILEGQLVNQVAGIVLEKFG